ncbi:glutamine synthetase nodule isozyme-like [Dorcoceras hygrometricum]|uniref:Glutamine synthetase nodule isozyme-like n=1 Tax=Dorcoceras hygrometricum TaxID=472368 RepID=A0A2Z7C4N9_9LAMI|nr:glutamine synthetase nodule isozyme-like [Dorcoceras hygrometricum]
MLRLVLDSTTDSLFIRFHLSSSSNTSRFLLVEKSSRFHLFIWSLVTDDTSGDVGATTDGKKKFSEEDRRHTTATRMIGATAASAETTAMIGATERERNLLTRHGRSF